MKIRVPINEKRRKKIFLAQIENQRYPVKVMVFVTGQIKKKRDEINITNIINDNTFNLHNSFLDNHNKYVKVSLKSKLIGIVW